MYCDDTTSARMLLSCFMRCASLGTRPAGFVGTAPFLPSKAPSCCAETVIALSAWLHRNLAVLFLHVVYVGGQQLARSDDGTARVHTTPPPKTAKLVGVMQLLHADVPLTPIVLRTSCEVIVREYWHMARSAVPQPEVRWKGNSGNAGVSSSSSLHDVSEPWRLEHCGASWKSLSSTLSEEDSLHESPPEMSGHSNMSHRFDPIPDNDISKWRAISVRWRDSLSSATAKGAAHAATLSCMPYSRNDCAF